MRPLARLLMVLALTMVPEAARSQSASGDWWGVLAILPGKQLRLAVHLAAGADGNLGGTLDSLDQKAMGLPLGEVTLSGDHLAFQLAKPPASFAGSWDAAAKSWRGEWRQNGQSWPLVLAAGMPTAAPAPSPLPANWQLPSDAAIAALIDARIAQRPGAGIVVGVLDPAGQRIVARGPVGATAFDGRTIFEIGSMTKVFTALILADMVAKGEVSLDDPAEKYLPARAKMPERGGRKITLRDLATHSSGLPRLPDNMKPRNQRDPYADYSEKQMLAFLAQYRLTRDIGSEFEYSNLGFGLLGYLLARAAHKDYADLVRELITAPLGLRDTAIILGPDQRKRFAQGHDAEMRPTPPWRIPTLAGAGAIRSTADDMLAFMRAAMDPNAPIAAAMKLTTADQRPMGTGRGAIGLAWLIAKPAEGRETLFHNGGTGGFRAAMMLEPAARRGVVVLTNAAVEPGSDDLAMHLLLGAPLQPASAAPSAKDGHD